MTWPLSAPPRCWRLGLALGLTVLLLHPVWAADFRGKVVGIADGDTITVLHDRQPETVRLNGIDAPEKRQAFGERAKQFTARLAFGQIVTVQGKDVDRYGRTIADVILPDGRSLNQEVVRAGYAWWFRRYSTDQRLGALEAGARGARAGLWADPNPVPPWEWRTGQQTATLGSAAPRKSGTVPTSPAPTNGSVIGNRRSLVYHKPGCPGYQAVSPANRVTFATTADAEAAGYRLAGNCR